MFNLGNLILTLSIATGVATTTPVYNAQNDTVIIDYEQNLDEVSTNSTSYPYLNLPTPPSRYAIAQNINDYEKITRYRSTSSFLSIYGTKYETNNYENVDGNGFIQNYTYIENNYDDYWKYTNTIMLVLQINTYNYNVGTKITLTNTLQIDNTVANNGQDTLTVNNRRFLKQVYTSNDDWSQYINRQLQIHGAEYIRTNIEDVNNNFYYVKDQTLTNVITIGSDQGYIQNDETELELEPNTTNYVIIEYIPLATQTINSVTNTDNQIMVKPFSTGVTQSNYKITGTNVIPDGTYEVIDIPGLMWQILTMPFAFVSQAFNLTLFPGTPYQINISNLFLSILAILAFVGLISMIVKMKG